MEIKDKEVATRALVRLSEMIVIPQEVIKSAGGQLTVNSETEKQNPFILKKNLK